MELKTWYENIGGDYSDIINRMRDEQRILKFLNLFTKDESYRQLKSAWENHNWSEVFKASHTLKGLAKTLGLKHLGDSASLLTDSVRDGYEEGISEIYYQAVNDAYAEVWTALPLLGIETN